MRMFAAVALVLSSTLTGCFPYYFEKDPPDDDTDVSDTTKIEIRSELPLSLILYRDDGDPIWRLPAQRAPTVFVAAVHGSYWVATVCESDVDLGDGSLQPEVTVTEVARTLGDGPLQVFCTKPAPTHKVRGTMAQAGRVAIGGNFTTSSTASWPFEIPVEDGTYTMYATTHDRVVIRRGVAVHGDTTVAPIDTTTEGGDLAAFSIHVTNADPAATINVAARVEQQSWKSPFTMSVGPLGNARLIPNSLLTPDDNQTLSVLSDVYDTTEDGASRDTSLASRRPFRIGDDPNYTLPAPIAGVTWAFEGKLNPVARWTSLPDATYYAGEIGGSAPGQQGPIVYLFDLSPTYLASTRIHEAAFATDLPGFKPAWQIDYALGYQRMLFAQRYADPEMPEHGAIDTSQILETIAPAHSAARAAMPLDTHAPELLRPRFGGVAR